MERNIEFGEPSSLPKRAERGNKKKAEERRAERKRGREGEKKSKAGHAGPKAESRECVTEGGLGHHAYPETDLVTTQGKQSRGRRAQRIKKKTKKTRQLDTASCTVVSWRLAFPGI